MNIKVKLLSDKAVMPCYANPGDAAVDLVATDRRWNKEHGYWEYDTDISLEIPEGFVGLIFPRSSISKYDLRLANSVGVVDSGYRGPISFRFKEHLFDRLRRHVGWFLGTISPKTYIEQVKYEVGDKIGQLIILPYPTIVFERATELSESKRGKNGWGSSGK